MSARHFTNHLDETLSYAGEGSYTAKRLVLYPIGAEAVVVPPFQRRWTRAAQTPRERNT